MANKKCPKCGEDNPAEAVMCWACYTPLTAGAGAAMGAGVAGGATTFPRSGATPGMGAGAAPAREDEKKKVDPRLFFVGGGLLLAGLVGAYTNGMFGGGSAPDNSDIAPPTVSSGLPGSSSSSSSRPPAPPPPPPPPAPSSGGGGEGGQQSPPPSPDVYSVIVPPSPHFTTATLAIAANTPLASTSAATTLAKRARLNLQQSRRWTDFQIVVFNDRNSPGATAFQQYMNDRRGAPLGPDNYSELSAKNAWQGAVIYYEAKGNSEHVYEPSRNSNFASTN